MSLDPHKAAVGIEKTQDYAEIPFAVAETSNLDFALDSPSLGFASWPRLD